MLLYWDTEITTAILQKLCLQKLLAEFELFTFSYLLSYFITIKHYAKKVKKKKATQETENKYTVKTRHS